eukprot:GHVS01096690.1.p1 GENE.GHVS01096690.1~~GHVS01096690.1.p1  ORF type:complete len:300 (+),score=9.06 GHVS01096690.1:44-901(+)
MSAADRSQGKHGDPAMGEPSISTPSRSDGLTSLFASLGKPTREPVSLVKRLDRSKEQGFETHSAPGTPSPESPVQHAGASQYGPTAYQQEVYQKEAGQYRLPLRTETVPPALNAHLGSQLSHRMANVFKAGKTLQSSVAQQKEDDGPEEYVPRRITRDPIIPCAQWQNMCREFRGRVVAGYSSIALLREFEKLDIYYRTTVSVLQHEIYLLDIQVNKIKTCCVCGDKYKQQHNDKMNCLHHRCTLEKDDTTACLACAQLGPTYSCCQMCSKCSQGCSSCRHSSYD